MMQAWRLRDGQYALIDDYRNETFHRRDEIKRIAGWWDGPVRQWIVSADAVDQLGAHRVVGVICESVCCARGGLEFRYASERNAMGLLVPITFCPHCDSHVNLMARVVEVLGEPPEARELWETEFRPQVEKWGGLAGC
jgi:hypothetical protein